MFKSLNVKFSILIGFLSFFIAIGVGYYSNKVSTSVLELNSGEALLKLSKRVNDVLDREMLERYREIKFASNLSIMTSKDSTISEKKALMQKIKDGYSHHEWIGYALPDGTVQIGTNNYLEGKNVKARPWHPEGLKGPYIGDVHDALLLAKLLPNNTGEAIYFSDVAFPVKNNEGETLGVLCTHLSWQWTRNVIRSIQKENNVDIFLLSNDGMILVGPEDSERSSISQISKNVANYFSTDESKFKKIQWRNGIEYLTASSVSKGFEEYKGFSWKVIVRQPIHDAYAKLYKNSFDILFISLFIGILGIIIGIVLSNYISKPLRKLSLIVDNLRENQEVKFMEKLPNGEIENLHNAIKNLYLSLNEEVKLNKEAQLKVDLALKVFEQSAEGIILTDENNNIILINKSFTEITGYTMSEVYGKNPSFLNSKMQDEKFYENMWNELSVNGKWSGIVKNCKKDGTIYEEYLKITSLKDESGKIINYVATFSSNF